MYPTFKIHGTQDTFTIQVRYIWDTCYILAPPRLSVPLHLSPSVVELDADKVLQSQRGELERANSPTT